jgi:hypothetical protein
MRGRRYPVVDILCDAGEALAPVTSNVEAGAIILKNVYMADAVTKVMSPPGYSAWADGCRWLLLRRKPTESWMTFAFVRIDSLVMGKPTFEPCACAAQG